MGGMEEQQERSPLSAFYSGYMEQSTEGPQNFSGLAVVKKVRRL
jgi:hypothetical protein